MFQRLHLFNCRRTYIRFYNNGIFVAQRWNRWTAEEHRSFFIWRHLEFRSNKFSSALSIVSYRIVSYHIISWIINVEIVIYRWPYKLGQISWWIRSLILWKSNEARLIIIFFFFHLQFWVFTTFSLRRI